MKLSPKLKIGLTIFLALLLLVVLNISPARKGIKNFFYSVSQPLQKALWRAGERTSDFLGMIFEMQNLKKENEELKLKVLELLAEKIEKNRLEKENRALRKALELGLEKEFELKIAKVVGKDISQDFILIDQGERDGILPDLPVMTEQKILVGEIFEVYEKFSKVALVSNKKSSLDVKIQEKEIEGVLKGEGNFKLSLQFLPKEKEIKEGDLVVTTSLSGANPAGLLVGQIKEVEKLDIEPFQAVKVLPAFEIGKIENLFIVIKF